MPVERAELLRIARTWLNVPYRHQGRNRLGVECGGLFFVVGREAGLTIIEPDTYSFSPDPTIIEASLCQHCDPIGVSEAIPGDVLWLSFAGEPRHVGLVTSIGLLHSWAGPGKVVEHCLDTVWRRRVKSAYRPKGIA